MPRRAEKPKPSKAAVPQAPPVQNVPTFPPPAPPMPMGGGVPLGPPPGAPLMPPPAPLKAAKKPSKRTAPPKRTVPKKAPPGKKGK